MGNDDYELFMDEFVELVTKTITNTHFLKIFERIKFDNILDTQEIKKPSCQIFKIYLNKKDS